MITLRPPYQQAITVDLSHLWDELADVVHDRMCMTRDKSPMRITLDVIQIYFRDKRSYNAILHHSVIFWSIYGKVYEIVFGKPLDRVMTTIPVRMMYGE